MNDVTDIIGLLYQRGQKIRDEHWAAYVASLERIAQELRQSEQFLADFGHLVPRHVQSAQPSHDMPEYMPPPLPPNATPDNRDAQLRVWQETFGRMPGEGA